MGFFDFLKKKPSVKSGEERKAKTNKKLQAMGITVNPYLPVIETSQEVTVKSPEEIGRRAITSLCMIQIACDILDNDSPSQSTEFFLKILRRFGLEPCKEHTEYRVLFSDLKSEENLTALVWTYESYWALAWALGLVNDISDASACCKPEAAIQLVSECQNFEEFMKRCHPRSIEDILDMLDLYYRYHWACVDHEMRPQTQIGRLSHDIVMERRRGLEWLISEEDDWFEISLDT